MLMCEQMILTVLLSARALGAVAECELRIRDLRPAADAASVTARRGRKNGRSAV